MNISSALPRYRCADRALGSPEIAASERAGMALLHTRRYRLHKDAITGLGRRIYEFTLSFRWAGFDKPLHARPRLLTLLYFAVFRATIFTSKDLLIIYFTFSRLRHMPLPPLTSDHYILSYREKMMIRLAAIT